MYLLTFPLERDLTVTGILFQCFYLNVRDFSNFCKALFLACVSQYHTVFRFILPNSFLPVCASTKIN